MTGSDPYQTIRLALIHKHLLTTFPADVAHRSCYSHLFPNIISRICFKLNKNNAFGCINCLLLVAGNQKENGKNDEQTM